MISRTKFVLYNVIVKEGYADLSALKNSRIFNSGDVLSGFFASGTQLHPASRKLPAGMVQLIPCGLFLGHVDSFTVWITFS